MNPATVAVREQIARRQAEARRLRDQARSPEAARRAGETFANLTLLAIDAL